VRKIQRGKGFWGQLRWAARKISLPSQGFGVRRSSHEARRSSHEAQSSKLEARSSVLKARSSKLDALRGKHEARRSTHFGESTMLDARRTTLDVPRSSLDVRRSPRMGLLHPDVEHESEVGVGERVRVGRGEMGTAASGNAWVPYGTPSFSLKIRSPTLEVQSSTFQKIYIFLPLRAFPNRRPPRFQRGTMALHYEIQFEPPNPI
jgi:hypothetical protein